MHETLLLGIAAAELTVLLTSDPRRWSRRLVLFVTLIIGVVLYSWLVLGVSTVANVTGTVLALVRSRRAHAVGAGPHRLRGSPNRRTWGIPCVVLARCAAA